LAFVGIRSRPRPLSRLPFPISAHG
jgi:hypothetical protein